MSTRRVPVLEDSASLLNENGNPPSMPDGIWMERESTQAEIEAETSVPGLQFKQSDTGRLFLSDANDGKYHEMRSYAYAQFSKSVAGPSMATRYAVFDSAPSKANRVVSNATDETIFIPPVMGAPVCTINYDLGAASNIDAVELDVDMVGVTSTPIRMVNGGSGRYGSFIVDLNLFPEYHASASDVTVSMLVRPLTIGLTLRGTSATTLDIEATVTTLPGALISNT